MDIIVSHMNLDFDGLACLLAAKKLHPHATVALTEQQQNTVKSFLAIYRDQLHFSAFKDINWNEVQTLILVDVASIKRTGIAEDQLPQSFHTIVYDHHTPKKNDVLANERYIEEVGAAITFLTERLLAHSIEISPFEATLFGLGLYTDTGNFTYPQVTARDLHIAAILKERGMDVALIERFSEQVLSTEEKKLFQTLLANGEEQRLSGLNMFITTHEQANYQGGLATLTRRLLEATDNDAAIAIVKMKKHVHVVVRASSNRVDFRSMMESLGGGGHAQAASATIKNSELADVVARVKADIFTSIKPAITAADIMARPVKFVSPQDEIQAVLEQMFQYGHTGFPVLNHEKQLIGVISRRDVDKATHHGLGHAPVKAYMSTQPITLPPDAPLEEIQATMMKHNIGRIPIIDNGKMVGILSRTDVIEQLHKQTEHPDSSTSEMIVKMQRQLPATTFKLLEKVGIIADQQNLQVYLIGGIVRDFLLNRQNEDIDLVVEGDGIDFAKKLAEEIGGEIKAHDAFGTATWTTPYTIKIDVVTCRTEYYEAPGQLPIVRASNIREDLRRRDFTINSMAIRINKKEFGTILDYFQGQEDINKKRIRILHNLSFIEDPTRIFRGVRFALRFNYQFAEQTKELAKDAAPMLKQISTLRLHRELDLLIAEGFGMNGLKMLDQLNVWTALFGAKPVAATWEHLKQVMAKQLIDPFMILTVLTFGMEKWKDKLIPYALTAKQNKLLQQLEQLNNMEMNESDSLGDLHKLLFPLSDEALVLYSLLSDKPFLLPYVEKRTQLIPFVTGQDLITLGIEPGPRFTLILQQLACMQLDQQLRSKEEAIKWLKNNEVDN